ncbi:hypothetical protein HAZT_HAZT005655 [Hyalella azteca]|uniref:Phosphatidylinositol transfer protein N-terminal domain-containing protein n=1 Tax=Hyalella azteca TaxID=294128 RepID=A0A6A0H8E8_HYAAZ|nr:hypothetical protein HAZT_HAZT005655 [Hyalella azteca]
MKFECIYNLSCVFQYQVGQLYSVAEASKNETGGGEGIEVLKNEPYTDHPLLGGKYTSGQYTYKIYHLKRQVNFCTMYICYLRRFTLLVKNPGYMKEKFTITVDTLHLPGRGELENGEYPALSASEEVYCSNSTTSAQTTNGIPFCSLIIYRAIINLYLIISTKCINNIAINTQAHELTGERLKLREVIMIDIANDPVKPADYKPQEDPTKFKSQTTGRGPLVGKDWQDKVNPVMTCYKLVTCEFKWFGLQNRVEKIIQDAERRLFTNFHRQVFCWIDRWHGLTMEDIRRLEDKTKEELSEVSWSESGMLCRVR